MAEIYLHNNGNNSDEFLSAKDLKVKLEEELSSVLGKIWLIPSVDVHPGTGVHDLDLLMIGYLDDYRIDISSYKDVSIISFCTTIEIKSHSAEGIYAKGQDLWVKYPSGDHNVTIQSNKQKITLINFFSETLQMGKRIPFVSNIIWLKGIEYDDFERSVGLVYKNIVTSDAYVDEFFDAIGRQSTLRDHGFVNAFINYTPEEIEKVANIFCAKSDGVDSMTLRRMNLLLQTTSVPFDLDQKQEPVIVLSGHAGTGKTIMLLQAADILTKKGKKCLFLTYNNALIADLQHTISLMPRGFSHFEMKSMHSFLISIMYQHGCWKQDFEIEKDFFPSIAKLRRTVKDLHSGMQYEYVFVDEAQDWEKSVADVLKDICQNSHIVIADGIDQFMRKGDCSNWGNSNLPKLKKCLRQRYNLTVFVKLFAQKNGVCWNVEPNADYPGGKVVVTNNYSKELHDELFEKARQHGCTYYDMMLLVPPSMIESGQFKLKFKYQKRGINIYDGTNRAIRENPYNEANAQNNESRLFSYESCRGLEAWTVVCHRFHELFEAEHPHSYSDIPFDAARKYMLTLWTLIPLTRAIDTLVIVVPKGTNTAKVLKEIADENPDFVEYKID